MCDWIIVMQLKLCIGHSFAAEVTLTTELAIHYKDMLTGIAYIVDHLGLVSFPLSSTILSARRAERAFFHKCRMWPTRILIRKPEERVIIRYNRR
jgi:hypothetical protein